MEFPVDCECGRRMMVREGLAGTRRTCECGRVVRVPSLHELRRDIGLPPYEISPELVVEQLLVQRLLPAHRICVCCEAETDDVLHVCTECERAHVEDSRGWWQALLVTGLLFAVLIRAGRREVSEHGKDKIYSLPLAVCRDCQSSLRGSGAIKKALRRVPEYADLLDKFPDAVVRL